MPSARYSRIPAVFGGLAGIALIAWWAAALLGALPTRLQPAQQQTSHVVVELALGLALLAGSWLDYLGARPARRVLAAALGALVYASVNVLGDFPHSQVMTALLAVTVAASVAMLVAVLLGRGRG